MSYQRNRGSRNRRWLWLLILLLLAILLVAALGLGGVFTFRNILLPSQQQRIIDQLPFMRALMAPTPPGGTLPTVVPVAGALSPADLLADLPTLPAVFETATSTLVPATYTALPSATSVSRFAGEVSATPRPTVTPSLAPALTPPPAVPLAIQESATGRPLSVRLDGFTHILQSWNNCGPANLGMALSYYGWSRGQINIAERVKPGREDKNVSPHELVSFVNEFTEVKALTRMGGDLELIKRLLAANMPVIVETGFMPEGYDWLGHYQTVVAYDDVSQRFWLYDSYLGIGEDEAGLTESYRELDANWQPFNRSFIVIYESGREAELRKILGEWAAPSGAAEIALATAREEARADRSDVFAWFNMGTALTRLGRYEEAAVAYDQARREGALPWRMTWYQFGPFEAYYHSGRLDDVLALVRVNMANGARYVEETWYWQGRVLQQRGDVAGARGAYTQSLNLNRFYAAAREALAEL